MQRRDITIVVGAVVLLILLLGLLGGGMMGFGGMMGWGGPWYGFGWGGILMGIVMLLFWVLLIGGVVWLVAWLVRQAPPGGAWTGQRGPSALDILRERYARGEIKREEYEQMKHDLEG